MIVLRFRSDAGERDLPFAGDVVRIGRKPDNDVVLADDRSSRHHARIEKGDGGFVLVDLGSQNGTLVGGRKVERHPLRVGDEIRIGATTLVVVSLGAPAAPAAAPDASPSPASPPAPPLTDAALPTVAETAPEAAEAGRAAAMAPPAAPAEPPAGPRLLLALRGEGEAREAAFAQDAIRIGRGADNDIVLADAKSSRNHARIETAGGERVLVDLDSHNGTLVRGEKVSRHVLRVGDEIRIGMTTLTVVSLGSAAAPAASPAPVPVSLSSSSPLTGEAPMPAGPESATPSPLSTSAAAPPPAIAGAGDTRTHAVRARGRRPSRLSGLATAAAFLLLFGGAGYLLLTMGPPRPSRGPGRVPGRASAPETEPVSTDDADPAWKALGAAVNDALKRGRFDEALAAVAGFRARHPGAAGGELEALVARVQSDAEADVRRVLERGGELERQRQADAACAWYAEALPRFRGTRGEPALQERVQAGQVPVAAVPVAAVPAATAGRPVEPEPPVPAAPVPATAAAAPARGLDVAALAGALAVASSAEAATRAFEAVLSAWKNPDLSEADRRELRARALEALRRNREDRVAALLGGKPPVLAGQLVAMKKELNRRREKALKAVFDPVFFPAAGAAADDPARGWRGVDRFVALVREAWDLPLALAADPRVGRDVAAVLAATEACAAALGPSAGEAEGPSDAGGLNGAVAASFRSFSLDGPEGAVYAWNRRVERYNGRLGAEIGGEVRELAALVNAYREMMGLRRCVIDPRLCRSGQKHAAACGAAGKVWVSGPDGTPKSRVEAEGFRGGVAEWATLEPGSPRDLWERVWYRSGDAHRSALKETWNSIGFGRDGRAAVLTFGNAIPPEGL